MAQKKRKPEDNLSQVVSGFGDKIKQFMSTKIETFERNTDKGIRLATKHKLGNLTFVQNEMTDRSLMAVGDLLIESDIFSIIKPGDGLSISVDPGVFVSHLIRKRLMHKWLTILLTKEDGTPTTEADFESRASDFLAFVKEVIAGFFTLNPSALKDIGLFLTTVFGSSTLGGQLLAMVLAGRNSSGLFANIAQKPDGSPTT